MRPVPEVTIRCVSGWWVVSCRGYHGLDGIPVIGCESSWEAAMEVADEHCPSSQRAVDEHGRLCGEFEQQHGTVTPAEFRTRITDARNDQHQEQQ